MAFKGGKKKIDPTKEHGYIGESKAKYKPPPRIIETPEWMVQYWLQRDRVIYADPKTSTESKQQIKDKYAK